MNRGEGELRSSDGPTRACGDHLGHGPSARAHAGSGAGEYAITKCAVPSALVPNSRRFTSPSARNGSDVLHYYTRRVIGPPGAYANGHGLPAISIRRGPRGKCRAGARSQRPQPLPQPPAPTPGGSAAARRVPTAAGVMATAPMAAPMAAPVASPVVTAAAAVPRPPAARGRAAVAARTPALPPPLTPTALNLRAV